MDEAHEAGWDSDPISEHRALRTDRATLAALNAALAERMDDLELRHAPRTGLHCRPLTACVLCASAECRHI